MECSMGCIHSLARGSHPSAADPEWELVDNSLVDNAREDQDLVRATIVVAGEVFADGVISGANAEAVAEEPRLLSEASPSTLGLSMEDRYNREDPYNALYDALRLSGASDLLSEANLWSQDNLDALHASGMNASLFSEEIHSLSKADLLTQDNLNALLASRANAPRFAEGLRVFIQTDLLTQDTFDALNLLSEANLLMKANLDALVASGANAGAVVEALRRLSETTLLTQDNFELLFDRNHLEEEKLETLLRPGDQLPSLLTQESFDEFIQSLLAQKSNSIRLISLSPVNDIHPLETTASVRTAPDEQDPDSTSVRICRQTLLNGDYWR